MRRFVYYLKTAVGNVRRNLILNLVAVVTITLAMLIMGAFVFLHVNIQNLVVSSTETLTLSVYLKDGLVADDVNGLKKALAEKSGVKEMRYVSKEQALADLKERLGEQGGLLEGLDENPLPASLELTLDPTVKQEGRVEALTSEIKAVKGVDDVSYAWDWADKLKVLARFVKNSGLIIGGLLFVAIVFIIANTIKLTVMARRDELYIMRLMGATETFVRTPFVLEGMTQGLCGGVLALAALYAGYLLLSTQVLLPFGLSLVKLAFLSNDWCLFIVGSGTVLGLFGSIFSVGRFSYT